MSGRRGFNPPWARGYIPNKGRPITGSQNPGPAKPKPTKPKAIHNLAPEALDPDKGIGSFPGKMLDRLN